MSPGHALAPEALAAAADIPVGQLVHEVLNRTGGLGDAVGRQVRVHLGNQAVQLGEHPLVHQAQLHLVQGMRRGVETVDLRIHGEERIHVLQRAQELALPLAAPAASEKRLGSHGAVVV